MSLSCSIRLREQGKNVVRSQLFRHSAICPWCLPSPLKKVILMLLSALAYLTAFLPPFHSIAIKLVALP